MPLDKNYQNRPTSPTNQVISGHGNPHKLCRLSLLVLLIMYNGVEILQFIRVTNIQSTVLSSSEGIAAIHLAFK